MYALIAGIVMLAAGILAFIPALNVVPTAGMPALQLDTGYGLFLGFIPMNIVNKIVLIVFGLFGIGASMAPATALPKSILWSRVVFFAMGLLAILGLFPQTDTLFGYWPLYSWNIAATAVFSILGAYFGYALSSRVPEQRMAPTHTHVAGVR
jgi:hypothetical protein